MTTGNNEAYALTISRMEWVAISVGNDTSSNMRKSTDDDETSISSRWTFRKVFDGIDPLNSNAEQSSISAYSTASLLHGFTKSSPSSKHHYYFDRSNGRCGTKICDAEDISVVNKRLSIGPNNISASVDGNDPAFGMRRDTSRKRKRSDSDLWMFRYIDSTHANVEEAVRSVDQRHLVPIYKDFRMTNNSLHDGTKIPILITATTEIYRLLAASQIHPLYNICTDTDVAVLEIGSSTGMTSLVVWQQLQNRPENNHHTRQQQRRWIGLDTGADMVKIVHEKLKKHNVNGINDEEWATCHHIDPLLDPDTASSLVLERLLSCRSESTSGDQIGPTKAVTTNSTQEVTVLIDIGGNREEGAVLRMVDWVIRTFQSSLVTAMNYCRLRQIIIKSESIHSTLTNNINEKDRSSIQSGKSWYMTRLRVALLQNLPKHPLQAPKRFLLPVAMTSHNNTSDGGKNDGLRSGEQKLICRYHNYHKAGCAKRNKVMIIDDAANGNTALQISSTCPYDHDHCHICLLPGHIARHCPIIFG